MRTATIFVSVVLLGGCNTMQPSEDAKAQVAATTQAWADAMSRHDIDRVLALYDPQAVLWGTRSPTLRDSPETVRAYFNILKTVPPSYKAVIGQQRIRVFGDMAVDSGTYTFSETHDGKEIVRPARFSMVFKNDHGNWRIIDHHSSAVPAP
jgi:uncharacterized protein (TIGR02246 family)